MDRKSSYLFSADVIRALAIIGVVAIHTANMVYARLDFFGGINWWFAIALDSLSRISVPLFILLSGFLLLGKNESFEHSLKRIGKRILIPLLFWTVVYTLWNGMYAWWNNSAPAPVQINWSLLQSILVNLFNGKVFHLYFLIILIGLYTIAPLLRQFLQKETTASQLYFMKWLLIIGAVETIGEYVFLKCSSSNMFSMWIPYTGLFLAGFLLGKRQEKSKQGMLLGLYTLGLTATLLFNYITYKLLVNGFNPFFPVGCISHYSDYFLSINVLFMAIPAFLLLLRFDYTKLYNSPLRRIIQELARTSFGIYLVHLLLIYVIDSRIYSFAHLTPLWAAILAKLFLILLLSYGITAIGMKLPLLKYIFGGN